MVVGSAGNSFSKEVSIRRRIANIFNKREEDFPSLREYNDYLEEVEDMTFKLVEGIDVPAIEAKIAKYQEENAEQIINNRARKAEEVARSLKEHQEQPATGVANDVGLAQNSQAMGIGQYNPIFMPPRPTGLTQQPVPIGGSNAHSVPEDEAAQRQRAERAARAGGWTNELCRKRAFEEAFSSLWVS
uniref:MAT1 centre domain-containing protein n=1 Tax=Araucaria cunninghamii TaxID=56994 RepID=A0A0D6R4C4_ARACU